MRKVKAIPGNLPLFAPPSTWKAPSLSDLPDWSRAKVIGIDSEFKDVSLRKLGIGARRGAKLAGYSFCLEGDRGYYVPLRHPGGGNVDCEQGLAYLRDNLGKYNGVLVGANMNVDLDVFHYEDIRPDYTQVECQDIQVRGPLINELFHKYSLEAEAERWGFKGKDETQLKEFAQSYGYNVKEAGWKACIPDLPCHGVGPYGEHDASILIPVFRAQQAEIDKQGLNPAVQLYSRVLPILLKMRQRGVRIDFDHLDKVEKWSTEEEMSILQKIKDHTNWDIGMNQCNAASRVEPALRALGIEVPLTDDAKEKGTIQYSITAEWLATIDHPVAKLIRQLRQVNKLRTTFCSSIRKYETNGRIHTTFRQIVGASEKNEKTGAAYGRLSSCHPNLQQQPSRGKFASFWRQIYLPEPGMLWCSSDLSAQEPRWAVHFSSILGLKGAEEVVHKYQTDPRIDPHQATSDITGLKRSDAKTVLLAVLYGEGDAKLCHHQLKLPTRWLVQVDREKHYFVTRAEALAFRQKCKGSRIKLREVAGEEAQEIMDKFHAGAPFYKELSRKVIEKVEATGVLKILGGRHLHFPLERDGSWGYSYKALNRLIQGTSAMQILLALEAVEKEFPGFAQLQIHDEIVGSVPDVKTAKRIAEIMSTIVQARVPWRSEIEIGPNWGQMAVICNEKGCLNFADPVDKWGCSEHSLIKAA